MKKENQSALRNHFDEIYLVNNYRGKEYWKSSLRRINNLGIVPLEFEAVRDFQNHHIDWKSMKVEGTTKISSPDEYTRLLTHALLMEHAMLHKHNRILILDDSCYFHIRFHEIVGMIHAVPKWSMIQLGGIQFNKDDPETCTEHFLYSNNTEGAFAYAIDRSMYERWLQFLSLKTHDLNKLIVVLQENFPYDILRFKEFPVISDIEGSGVFPYKECVSYGWFLMNYDTE